MSGLAKYLLQNGCEVSGSDISESKYTEKVKKLGATVHIGHKAENVPANCIVVASTAIREDNPEILRAKELGLPIYHRSDVLAEISRSEKCFVGFSGTHGKTTTSGLCSYVLEKAGLNPSFVDGGIIPELDTNAQCKKGQHFIAELDESDGTIIKYSPDVVVVNNLEADHLDFYKNGLSDILNTFTKFLLKLKPEARILLNVDDDGVMQLLPKLNGEIYTYGIDNDADFIANNINYGSEFTTFDVYFRNQFIAEFKIILKGRHNIYNTLAVISALCCTGVDVAKIKEHFSTFSGMGRRFQFMGELTNGVKIYDDYAHHPTEINAALSAAKQAFTDKKIIAVFQPHRYSRLQSLWGDFAEVLKQNSGKVYVTDVYAASEDEITGVTGANFAKEFGFKHVAGSITEVAKELLFELDGDEVVIGLGAGTITNLSKELFAMEKEMAKLGN